MFLVWGWAETDLCLLNAISNADYLAWMEIGPGNIMFGQHQLIKSLLLSYGIFQSCILKVLSFDMQKLFWELLALFYVWYCILTECKLSLVHYSDQ